MTPGMRIGIKANLVSFLPPERAATTHPVVLQALTELLKEKGADVVIGDSPGGIYTSPYVNHVYNAAGLSHAAKWGAELNQDFSQRTANFPEGMAAKQFPYTAWLDRCDAVINFCKLKSHGMMSLSACAKNLFGIIPGSVKPEFHFKYPNALDFARMIVDLNAFLQPRLCLVDGIVGMEGNGPTAGTPKPMGMLLAGENPHKVDLVCAALLGIPVDCVPTLQAARERALIPETPEELELSASLSDYYVKDFHRVEQASNVEFEAILPKVFGKLVSPLLRRYLASRPAVQKDICIGCKKCLEICPAHAISMKKGVPIIQRKTCIRCFCCQEFCPKGAMQVKRPPLARLLNR